MFIMVVTLYCVPFGGVILSTVGLLSSLHQSNITPSWAPSSTSVLVSMIELFMSTNWLPSHLIEEMSSDVSVAESIISSVLGCWVNLRLLIPDVAKFEVVYVVVRWLVLHVLFVFT